MKIALFELEGWQKKEVKDELKGHKLIFLDEPLSEENIGKVKDAGALVFFIYSKANKKILDKLPNLKLITTMSTGFDHIDVKYCKKKGITVCNVPTYGENTVAEQTFSLILALSRKLYPSIKRTHENHSFETDKSLRGFDLKGRSMGIIGCGHIGQHVARIAVGFEMKVLVYDPHPDKKLAKRIGFTYVTLDGLFAQSDIISLHVPYNKYTHHLINKKTIKKMKDGVYIVNTARGGVIDTHALIEALKSGKIAGAGLDVLEGECDIKEEAELLTTKFKDSCDLQAMLEGHMLMKMDNVIITPHNAFNSKEALSRILHTTVENIEGFAKRKPKNQIC